MYTVIEIRICGRKFLRTDEKSHKCSQSLFNDGNDNAVSRLIKVHKSLGQFLFIRSNSSVYSIFSIYWLISDLIPKKPKSIPPYMHQRPTNFKTSSWSHELHNVVVIYIKSIFRRSSEYNTNKLIARLVYVTNVRSRRDYEVTIGRIVIFW